MIIFQTLSNRLCHLIASLLASIVIDRGFDPWSGQSKDYKTGIWCNSAMHAVKWNISVATVNFIYFYAK
jgi:hypothetical protein